MVEPIDTSKLGPVKCSAVPTPEEDRERLIRKIDEAGDFVTGEDGFVLYWPSPSKAGAYSAHVLRWIADELDRRNAAWAAQIEKELGKPNG